MVVLTLFAAPVLSWAGVQPQLAAAAGHTYLAFGQGSTITVVHSLDEGVTFTTPSQITVSGKMALGMRQQGRVHVRPVPR